MCNFPSGNSISSLKRKPRFSYLKAEQTCARLTPDDAKSLGSGRRSGNLKPIMYKWDSVKDGVFITDVCLTCDWPLMGLFGAAFLWCGQTEHLD